MSMPLAARWQPFVVSVSALVVLLAAGMMLVPEGSVSAGPATPPNDNFADAFLVDSSPFNASQSTSGATVEAGEPQNPIECLIFPPNFIGATVWYTFTTTSAGTMNASTAGSGFDTVLALYTGTDVASLTALDCDDDSGPGALSKLSVPLQADTTYYLQVGGFSGRSGDLVLNVAGGFLPTPTPPSVVGGVSLGSHLRSLPLETNNPGGSPWISIAATIAAAGLVLGSAAWYAKRRSVWGS